MHYDREFPRRGRSGRGPRAAARSDSSRRGHFRPHPVWERPRPSHEVPRWRYRGPGEAGRYGDAPVEYGPEHTYDYHLGDRYGYGPDYLTGDERVRRSNPRPFAPRERGPRRWRPL